MEHPHVNPEARNYNTISPSARSLLLLKGLTTIPFARSAAKIAGTGGEQIFDVNRKRDILFWGRLVHFENRYWSIDQLLEGLNIKNILELSSGFSFRGLETVKDKGFHYIDTDLPELIETKKAFLAELQKEGPPSQSTLETVPLNALDRAAFNELVSHFPPGEIAIVNEGLLMYLGMEEKEQVCSIIRKILQERGGYWLTADIYVKRKISYEDRMDGRTKDFFQRHNVEENKFDSFESAEAFFKKQGFEVDKEATFARSKVTALKPLLQQMSFWQKLAYGLGIRKVPKIQATWRLKLVD